MKLPDNNTDELRQYLLGLLPETKRNAIDQRILADSKYYEELRATEEELVDEYLSGGLTKREFQQFEVLFAIGEERQKMVRFGRSWREHLQARSADLQEATPGLGLFSVLNRPTVRVPLFVALSVVILLGIWFGYQRTRQISSSQQFIAVTLAPGAVRSDGQATQRFKRPPANSTVNVELEIATNDYSSYTVELSKENEVIKPFNGLLAKQKEGHFIVVVPVTSELLEEGDYTFTLTGVSGDAQPERQGSYHLRVIQ
jgi:hypothetical protein